MGCYRRPPTPPAPQGKEPSDPLAAQLRARLRMLREPSTVKIMLSGTSLISVQYGVGILTVLHLHRASSVGAGKAALVLVASQGAGVAGRICLAAWSDRSRSGRYAIVLVCMVAVIAGLVVLMAPAGRAPVVASGVFVWLGFFGFGWYGPWVAYVTEAAPPGRTGSALGLAMSVNQIAIVTVPPVLGLLVDRTSSFTPAWALLILLTVVALAVTAATERRPR